MIVALPVVLIGGFSIAGWAIAAVLWAGGEALGFWLARVPTGVDRLRQSALVALAMSFRGIGVMVALLAITVADRRLGLVAVVVYALAYTLSLAVSLVEYFLGEARS